MEYTKPHLTYEEQLGQLESRGLTCADREEATGILRTVGYYRFSAYAYPFRELLPAEAPRESEVQYRSDVFQPGASFVAALNLYRFDHKLRMLTFEGLRSLELTLRVRIAYVLGKRDIFGHVRPNCLNLHGSNAMRHEHWVARYTEHVQKASSKDFVKHFLGKYDGDLPIWVAMEVVDFGSLSTLFRLLDKRDKNEIAEQFGLRNGGDRLEKWLQHLNNVRNTCAHHGRLWNAQMLYPLGGLPMGMVGDDLGHVATAPADPKVYRSLAVLAYLLRSSDPITGWPSSIRTLVRKFPGDGRFTPENDMGFPVGWDKMDLWLPLVDRAKESQTAVRA